MGDAMVEADERPCAVRIERAFWMGRCEVTNEQYARFDATHESRYEDKGSWSFSEGHLGWPLDGPKQPVIRVSQNEATAFCRWLSEKIGESVLLPTEAQWEWACRAGTDTAFWYGGLDTDFAKSANLADVSIRRLGYETDGNYTADLVPRDARFNDKALVTVEVGKFAANPWGLFDTHGNAWEWTRTAYRPYPYRDDDGRNAIATDDRAVVRGGSWYDRPKRARSAFRLSYPAWQRVYNVGFRIVIEKK
jgi:formylglycine-generating enzyme required for sulfatase activity